MDRVTTAICPDIIRRYNPRERPLLSPSLSPQRRPLAFAIRWTRTRRSVAGGTDGRVSCASPRVDEGEESRRRRSPLGRKPHSGGGFLAGVARRSEKQMTVGRKFLPLSRSPRRAGRVPVSDFLINFTRINTNVFIFCVPPGKTTATTASFHPTSVARSLASSLSDARAIPALFTRAGLISCVLERRSSSPVRNPATPGFAADTCIFRDGARYVLENERERECVLLFCFLPRRSH